MEHLPYALVYSCHIQIFIRTKTKFRYQGLNRLLGIGKGNNWEIAKSPADAWNYCGEEKPDPSSRHGCASHSFGQRPRETARRGGAVRPSGGRPRLDLSPIITGLRSGRQLSSLARDDECLGLIIRHPAGIKFAQQLLTAPANTPEEWSHRNVYVYWGNAGAGKSRAVRQHCAEAGYSLWVAPIGSAGVWYDGYDNHDAALFDDFACDMSFRDLLNLLEGNNVLVPVKGAFVCWRPRVVFFTCDRPPNEWEFTFGAAKQKRPLGAQELAQLERRITQVIHLPIPLNLALGMPVIEDINVNGGGGNNDTPPPFDVEGLINDIFD